MSICHQSPVCHNSQLTRRRRPIGSLLLLRSGRQHGAFAQSVLVARRLGLCLYFNHAPDDQVYTLFRCYSTMAA